MLFLQIKFTGLWLSFLFMYYLCIYLFIIKFIFQETSSIFTHFYLIFLNPVALRNRSLNLFFTLILSKNKNKTITK